MSLFLLACVAPPPDCGLTTTIPDYAPTCQAELLLYPEEARLRVDGRLEAFLPPDPPDGLYGGSSGQPLTLLFDGELAQARTSTLVLAEAGSTARIDADFEAGRVEGLVRLDR